MNKKKCPICGAEMKIDTSAVCTSIPPQYRCVCPSCNCLDFIKTSEYDQYKEEPSLPSVLEEAADDAMFEFYGMGPHFRERPEYVYTYEQMIAMFKAGAEWMAGKFQKIEGDLVDWYSTSDGKDYCCGVKTDEAFEIPEGFYIRKKQ